MPRSKAAADWLKSPLERANNKKLLRLHHAALDNASEAIFWIDQESRFLYFNKAASRSLGYSRAELAVMTVSDINPWVPPEEWPARWQQLVEEGELTFETQHRRKCGATFPVEASAHHLVFDGQEYACVSARDISARKQAQQEQRSSERRYKTLTEVSPVGIFRTDKQGRCLFVNQRWCEIAGLGSAAARGEGWSRALHPEDRERVFSQWQRATQTGQPFQSEYRFLHKDGTIRWVIGQAVDEHDDHGEVVGQVGTVTDISAYKEAEFERLRLEETRRDLEAQVQHAQKLESLGVLAGGIAHDFNNLLGGILGNAELVLNRLESTAPVRPLVQEISLAADRCAELANQMLAYSGKGKFVLERVDLGQMVQEMVDLLHLSMSKKAHLHFDFPPGLPPIEGDPTQIRQVVMNLITNASDALGEESGHIHLRTGMLEYTPASPDRLIGPNLKAGSYVFLEVEDTGCGMDEATRSRLFDPFFTTKLTGRGLGMAAVLGIVRAHNAAIQVESSPGEGTNFRVLFHASTGLPTAPLASPEKRTEPWRGSGVILVVDDEKIVRVLARSILEEAGFEVLECEDGRAALNVFKSRAQDIVVVLLDMTMPELDGEETFRGLRRIRPDVRVILSSGYSRQVALNQFGEYKIAGFLQKPYRPMNLLEKVQEVLAVT